MGKTMMGLILAALAALIFLDLDARATRDKAVDAVESFRSRQRESEFPQMVEIRRGGRVLLVEQRRDGEGIEDFWDRVDNPPPQAKVSCWESNGTEYELTTTPLPDEMTQATCDRHDQLVAEGQERHPKTGECAP